MSGETPTTTDALRRCGLRVTAPRRVMLDWLSSHPHATADEIHRGVLGEINSVSKQAVYDALAACVEVELVRQIKPAGHPARFERRTGDNHHHLVCRECGSIADIDCHAGQAPCLHPGEDHGFVVDEAEIVFWGLCRPCQNAQDSFRHTGAAATPRR